MRFQVPQFIEVEDKIFGPLTFKQFAYLAGAAGITVVFLVTLPLFLAIILSAPFIALGAALAFYKVNNRPFIDVMESALGFFTKDKLYLWEKRERKPKAKEALPKEAREALTVPTLSQSKLKDLAWSLDIHEGIERGNKKRDAGLNLER